MIKERQIREIERILENHGVRSYSISIKDGKMFVDFYGELMHKNEKIKKKRNNKG